ALDALPHCRSLGAERRDQGEELGELRALLSRWPPGGAHGASLRGAGGPARAASPSGPKVEREPVGADLESRPPWASTAKLPERAIRSSSSTGSAGRTRCGSP